MTIHRYGWILLVSIIAMVLTGCHKPTITDDQVTIPVFSPVEGTYYDQVDVTITTSTLGTTILYTTDGSDPNSSSAVYSGPISILEDTVIKAKAFRNGLLDSPVASATYIIEPHPVVSAPVLNLPGGTYISNQTVSISCTTPGSIIYYAFNENPTEDSEQYTGPINVSSSCAIKAKAYKDGWEPSPIVVVNYEIEPAPVITPHLGDTGDPPVVFHGHTVYLNDTNNGIDAVPEGNWIRVSWVPFQVSDQSYIKIFRYSNLDLEPVLLATVSPSEHYYIDDFDDLAERVYYSYFIDLVSPYGGAIRSDTSSYALLSKSLLLTPTNNATISPLNTQFSWNRSGTADKYRLLILDSNNNYIWHQDLLSSQEEDPLSMSMPINLASEYSGHSLKWRVDSFEWSDELQVFIGSESIDRIFHLQ